MKKAFFKVCAVLLALVLLFSVPRFIRAYCPLIFRICRKFKRKTP